MPSQMEPFGTRSGAVVRVQQPRYVERLPPCNTACPAGENIQAWLAEAQAGRYRAAWEILVRDNPLPAVHGRVCYHPCEGACNRAVYDGAVSVHAVERYIGDLAVAEGWTLRSECPPTGMRALVVGAGPAGLSAAWHLALAGHAVVIYEAAPYAGGMMHFGIPKYRLPREILDAEIARIEAAGVTIVLNRRVEDLEADKLAGHFDAVFLAVGAHVGKRQEIPADGAGRIYDALEFLRQSEENAAALRLGRRVAVYGGGNTAMDAARTARRLSAEVVIIYRRTREQMPAHSFEADDALEEGVRIEWLRTISAIRGSCLTLEVMALDAEGFPRPTGQSETIEADTVILALGQEPESGFLRNLPGIEVRRGGIVSVGADMQTGCAGIFAGGDMVPFDRSVTEAVGHGKKAARNIDRWLRGGALQPVPKHELAAADMLRPWYGTSVPAGVEPRIELAARCGSFDEVVGGLGEAAARIEAQRCFSCGNCFHCDGCYAACPERAIERLGGAAGYRCDLDTCTGCGLCADQCPCGALVMVPAPV